MKNQCGRNSECLNTAGSYECICNLGYVHIEGQSKLCRDQNECTESLHPCHNDATCDNTDGSYTCTCNEGYTENGNATECNDVDVERATNMNEDHKNEDKKDDETLDGNKDENLDESKDNKVRRPKRIRRKGNYGDGWEKVSLP